jgi:hypothetical protein
MGTRTFRLVTAALLAIAAGPGVLRGGAGEAPTREALESERRRVAALESELALASTRKPYLVLDLESKSLRYRLLGMTLREMPLPGLRARGLVPAVPGTQPETPGVAGIFSVREKEDDPRLNPLTPEQVEAGADDENAANVLPPEPPRSYRIWFKQPVLLRVAEERSTGGLREGWEVVRAFWDRLRGARGKEKPRLEFSVRLDEKTSAEVYRSLVPDLRWLVLPPRGYHLPPAGQEPPPKPRAPRAAPKPPPKPIEPPGVPFQIPSPVDESDLRAGVPAPPPEQDPAPGPPPPADTHDAVPEDPAPAGPVPEDPASADPNQDSPGGGQGPPGRPQPPGRPGSPEGPGGAVSAAS